MGALWGAHLDRHSLCNFVFLVFWFSMKKTKKPNQFSFQQDIKNLLTFNATEVMANYVTPPSKFKTIAFLGFPPFFHH